MIWKKRAWAAVRWAALVAATEGLEEFDVHYLVRRAFEPIRARSLLEVQQRIWGGLDSPPSHADGLEAVLSARSGSKLRADSATRNATKPVAEGGAPPNHAFAQRPNGRSRIENRGDANGKEGRKEQLDPRRRPG